MSDLSNLTDPPYPRGIVNNNPGNLRSGIPWQGQKLGIPGAFCAFVSVEYGCRAMAIDLTNKITKDGLNTIALEVTKYAPPSENNTDAYIQSVSSYTGWGANDPIDLSGDNLALLMKAHIQVEQGAQYATLVTDDAINTGISMMGQSLVDATGVTNFFVTNPQITAAAGLGIVAVAFMIMLVLTKRINLLKIKNTLTT